LGFTYSADYDIPASTAGTAITPINVSGYAFGGTPPYTFTATGLPDGITISEAGVISGTPTTASAAVQATITVTDAVSASKSIKIWCWAIAAGAYPLTLTIDGVTVGFNLVVDETPPDCFQTDNGSKYKRLDTAINNVAEGGTITMLCDVALHYTSNSMTTTNKICTIDFNGHTLSNGEDLDYLMVINGGEETVTLRNGTLINTYGSCIEFRNLGAAILDEMEIRAENSDPGAVALDDVVGYVSILSGEYYGWQTAVKVEGTSRTGATITAGHFSCAAGNGGNGCLTEIHNGIILLTPGSTADADPWKNDPGATDVTVTAATPPPTYGLSIGTFAGGSVSAGKTGYEEGETVTLTIAPDAGYELDAISACKTGDAATTVTLQSAGSSQYTFTMPNYGVTVAATFKKTQEELDREAVEALGTAIEGGTFKIAQATGNDAGLVKTWLVATLNQLFGQSHNAQFRSSAGANPVIGEVTVTSVIPAIAGTESNPDGINGSFKFTVGMTSGETTLMSAPADGIIIATPKKTITGMENPQAATLVAWMQRGVLHVSGLTAGKSWQVYDISGRLIYHETATGVVATRYIGSTGQRILIVQSEGKVAKVIEG